SEHRGAVSLAQVTAGARDRFAEAGLAYAENPLMGARPKGLANIIVTDADGAGMQLHRGPAPPDAKDRGISTFGNYATLSLRQGDRRITVLFDPRALAPESLSDHARLVPAGGPALLRADRNPALHWIE